MDAKSFRSGKEGSVLNSVNSAGVLTQADSEQNRFLLRPDICGILSSKPKRPHFHASAVRSDVVARNAAMFLPHVFLLRKPLKVVSIVVSSAAVLVMDDLRHLWSFKPAQGDKTMDKAILSGLKVSIFAQFRDVWSEFTASFSKNFPALGNCVSAIDESIFDSIVNVCGQHLRLRGYGTEAIYLKS